MNVITQIPRNALAWIILAMFALLAPHLLRLPLWVIIVYGIAVLWRIQVYRGQWSFPGNIVKVAMTLTCFIGIYLSYGSLIGLEPTVALLMAAFALKLIELCERKDAYVLLFLGYFICLTEFLFSQDILITLYSVFMLTIVTTALVALHQPGEHRFTLKTLRSAGVMLLQAVPMMLVLFFVFPRFGPLWTVPIKSHTAKTGMSDFMRPGDVAKLSQSDEVAFRVKFEGDIPAQSELYWRGLVFSRLERGTWSTLGYYDVPLSEQRPQPVDLSGDALSYTVIMEPTQQNWLYGLHYARGLSGGVMQASDYRLFTPGPLETEYLYRVRSWLRVPVEQELSEWRRETELKLPPRGNERARALASSMRAQVSSDAELVIALLQKFNTEQYVYTLKPGLMKGANGIDTFLFERRRGFCEHYAAAFVFMLRAAGIPARVVAGYQGGEINPVNKTVIVHQFDAHAWAEVWLPGRGWVRYDPTAAVSPSRIEWGLEEAMSSEGSFLEDAPLSPLRYRKIPLLNRLRLEYDALTYRWQSWVVGFNREQQFSLLHDLFGEISVRLFVLLLLGSWALVLIPLAVALLRKEGKKPQSVLTQHYQQFASRLEKLGLVRAQGETAGEFAQRVSAALPEYASEVLHITQLYERIAYSAAGSSASGTKSELNDEPNSARALGAVQMPSDTLLKSRSDRGLLAEFSAAVSAFKPRRRGNSADLPVGA